MFLAYFTADLRDVNIKDGNSKLPQEEGLSVQMFTFGPTHSGHTPDGGLVDGLEFPSLLLWSTWLRSHSRPRGGSRPSAFCPAPRGNHSEVQSGP